MVRAHLISASGNTLLSKLTSMQVQHFVNQQLARGLSTRSVQYELGLLRKALGQAVKWKLVSQNVAKAVDAPKVVHKPVVPLDEQQTRHLLEAVRGDRLEALYTLVLAIGLRRGEVLGLKWTDIDWENGTLRIQRSLQRVSHSLQLTEPKTQRSKRTVLLPQFALAALKAHRVRQVEERLATGDRWQEQGMVFTTGIGTPLDPRTMERHFDAVLVKASLPKIRFHDLRHGCATLLLAQGVPITAISELLGHADTSITAQVYLHRLDTMRHEAADQMDRLLGEAI